MKRAYENQSATGIRFALNFVLIVVAGTAGAAMSGTSAAEAGGSSAAVVDISGRQPGSVVELRLGDLVELRLPGTEAGYSWVYVDTGAGVVEDSGERGLSLSGGERVESWRLQTLRPGRQTVIFELRRPWETEVAPIRTVSYDLVVIEP